MNMLALFMEYGPPIISGIFAAMAVSQNQSAKKMVNTVAPTIGTVINALPQIIADVQKGTTPAEKVETAVKDIAQVLTPVLPQAQHVVQLINAMEALAKSISDHTETVKQKPPSNPS